MLIARLWLATGVDVLDVETVAATVAQVIARWRRIDVLVNTVGGFQGGQPLLATPISRVLYVALT